MTMFKREDEAARGVVLERSGGDPVMPRAIRQAWRAQGPCIRASLEWALASGAGRISWYRQPAPALGAKPGLRGQPSPAQRAARREDQVDYGREKRVNLHVPLVYRLRSAAWQGRARSWPRPRRR